MIVTKIWVSSIRSVDEWKKNDNIAIVKCVLSNGEALDSVQYTLCLLNERMNK